MRLCVYAVLHYLLQYLIAFATSIQILSRRTSGQIIKYTRCALSIHHKWVGATAYGLSGVGVKDHVCVIEANRTCAPGCCVLDFGWTLYQQRKINVGQSTFIDHIIGHTRICHMYICSPSVYQTSTSFHRDSSRCLNHRHKYRLQIAR